MDSSANLIKDLWLDPSSELQEEALQVKTLYISASTANLRSGPSLSSAVVDKAEKRYPMELHSKIR